MTRKPHNPAATTLADEIVTSVAQFCAREGHACYGKFSPETLRDYIEFHIAQLTLSWCTQEFAPSHRAVAGVGVAWQCNEDEILQADFAEKYFFNWQPDNPQGNSIFIADVVASTPEAALALVKRFAERWPNWNKLAVYTYRRGRLTRIEPTQVLRFFHQQHLKLKD